MPTFISIVLLVLGLTSCSPASRRSLGIAKPVNASVKMADGQIVTGTINGIIVQKGYGRKALVYPSAKRQEEVAALVESFAAQGKAKPIDTSEYIVTYTLKNGADIATITEQGVSAAPGSTVASVVVGTKNEPEDGQIFEDVLANSFLTSAHEMVREIARGGWSISFPANNQGVGQVVEFARNPQLTSTDRLLGELRREQGKWQIIPTLNVSTAQGVVTIPVEEIAGFTGASALQTSHASGPSGEDQDGQ